MREIVANLPFKNKSAQIDVKKLSKILEDAYLSQRRPPERKAKKSFAPSGIGYGHNKCARYWYQAFNGAVFEENTDAMGVANMSNGTYTHDRIQKLYEDAGILKEKELEINLSSPPIRGYIDAIVELDDEKLVAEIKTTNSRNFAFRQNSMNPSVNHLYQMLIYLKVTGLTKGFMHYENKDDQSFLIIPVTMNPRNEKIINDAFAWMNEVHANWVLGGGTNSHIPQRPFTKKSVVCKGCPLFAACWPEGDWSVPKSDVVINPMETPTL